MGWERRGEGVYYYRARKVAGRVVRQYFGCGEQAATAAAADVAKRAELEQLARAWCAEQVRLARADSAVDRLTNVVQAVVRAHLLLRGFHQHAGNWRRRRGS